MLSVLIFVLPSLLATTIHSYIIREKMNRRKRLFILVVYFFLINCIVFGISYIRGVTKITFEGMTITYKVKYLALGGLIGVILPCYVCMATLRKGIYTILRKSTVKIVIFCLIFCIIFIVSERILTEKWTGGNQDITYRYKSFYDLPPNTLDYIILGASGTYRTINPMLVYAQSGYAGYAIGSPSQPSQVSYYMLKEAYKSQTFKYCFFDVKALIRSATRERIIQGLTYMRPSLLKVEAAYSCQTSDISMLELIFPMISFHSRWKDLTEDDFGLDGYHSCFKGTYLSFKTQNNSKNKIKGSGNQDNYLLYTEEGALFQNTKIEEEKIKIFQDVYFFCQQNDIELIPYIGASIYTNEFLVNMMKDFLKEYNLELWTPNDNEIINWELDTYDSGFHTNYWGNCKSSDYLIKYLDEKGDLLDHRGDIGYEVWDNEVKEYEEYEEKKLRTNKEKILSYLQILEKNKDDLCLIFSGKEDICMGWSDELQHYMERLGLEADFYNNVQNSYIGVVDGGIVRIDDFAKYPMAADIFVELDSGRLCHVEIESGGYIYGNKSKICVSNQSYSLNNSGMNIVVIDKNTGKTISSASIGTNTDELTFKENIHDDKLWKGYVKDGEKVLEEGIYLINSVGDSKYALEIIEETGNGMILQSKEINYTRAQQFEINYCGNSLYTIKSIDSGKYYTVNNFGNDRKTDVVLEEYTGLSNQKWFIYENENDHYVIMSHYNRLPIGFACEEKNMNLQFQVDDNTGKQQFNLVRLE